MNEVRRPVPGRATYEDVMDAPPNTVAELVDGVLHLSPRPAAPHAFTAGAIGAEIMAPFGYGRSGPGGWWIVPGPELHFDADVLVPDLAGWRRERMPVYPRVPHSMWRRTGSARSSRRRPGPSMSR